jgi:glutamate--cysteine ligase
MLMRGDNGVPLQTWAREILEDMTGVCELLDRGRGDGAYSNALASQAVKVADPEETPSALILEAMRSNGEPFFTFAMRMSRHHREQFVGAGPLQSQRHELLQREVARSLEKQREIEAADRISFESYLETYFGN